jgi:hypothetical protein
MSTATTAEMTDNRAALVRQAFRLEYITLAWMTIEAAVAIGSGVSAGSLTLTAFGIDSLIELASSSSAPPAKYLWLGNKPAGWPLGVPGH